MVHMFKCLTCSLACLLLIGSSVLAQTPAPSTGMQTYSPYTPQQIKELNSQPLSPAEGPFGPVAPSAREMDLSKKQSIGSNFYSQPKGEEEAEALETESAAPYQPISPVISF